MHRPEHADIYMAHTPRADSYAGAVNKLLSVKYLQFLCEWSAGRKNILSQVRLSIKTNKLPHPANIYSRRAPVLHFTWLDVTSFFKSSRALMGLRLKTTWLDATSLSSAEHVGLDSKPPDLLSLFRCDRTCGP
jgi:hypothetical protein